MPCSRRAPSTARLSTARHRLVEAPACSASPQPAGRERARRAHAQSCSSRATACPSLEYLLWTDPPSPGCAASLASGGQPSVTPQLPCSLTQRLRSSLQCPARSSRCCHPPPDPCHTLGQPLCARCGGDPPDLWSPLGSFPELPCSRSCSARSLCLCAAGRWQPLSATPTLWEWVRAGMS